MAKLILYHGEPYQRKKAVDKALLKWREAMSEPEIYRFEADQLKPEKLEQLLGGSSLFSETKIVRVTQADELSGNKTFTDILEAHSFETEALLLEADSVKKSTSLYKLVDEKGLAKKFPEPTGRNFPKYVSQITSDYDVQLTSEARRWLIQVLEQNLLRVESEAKKLSLYNEEGKLGLEQVKEVVWTRGKDRMFDFFDAIFSRETEEAMKLLEDMIREGVEETKIFYMLAREVRRLIKIQSLASDGLSNKEISSETGIYNWLVKKKRGQLNNYSLEELEDMLYRLHREDLKVKQGRTDIDDALFQFVYRTYAEEV